MHVANGTAFDATPISLEWFNPFGVESFSAFAAGVSLSIFIFWGWDVTLTMNEETKDPDKIPGRAATLTILIIMGIYMLVSLAVISYAGTGDTGLGAGNPENQEIDLRRAGRTGHGAVRDPDVPGHPLQLGGLAAVHLGLPGPHAAGHGLLQGAAASASAGSARASCRRRRRPSRPASPPPRSTWSSGCVSENALWDTITALGMMICFYYGITALACVWYFRRELFARPETSSSSSWPRCSAASSCWSCS